MIGSSVTSPKTEIIIPVSGTDYAKFFNAYFRKEFLKRVLYIIVISCIYGLMGVKPQEFQIIIFLKDTAIAAICIVTVLLFIPYLWHKIKISRHKGKSVHSTIEVHATLHQFGVKENDKMEYMDYSMFKAAERVGNFFYLRSIVNEFYILPMNYFPSIEEENLFLQIINDGFNQTTGYYYKAQARKLYFLSIFSFFPYLGVLVSIVMIGYGIKYNSLKLQLIALPGILFTVILWLFSTRGFFTVIEGVN